MASPGLKNWGVPFAPTVGRGWPVLPAGGASPNRAVPFTRADDTVAGNAATRFHAGRQDGVRWHAGVDLVCFPGDRVVAIAPGTVLGWIPGFVRLDAVVVDHGEVVCVYAEIQKSKADVAAGAKVRTGDLLGLGVLNDSGHSMLHFETWAPGHAPLAFVPWFVGSPPPVGLLDPTALLLTIAVGNAPQVMPFWTPGRKLAAGAAGLVGLVLAMRSGR